jgi:O-6-methylguanine DNA methyltransferase
MGVNDSLFLMKEQILPSLPVVGKLKLYSQNDKAVCLINVVKGPSTKILDPFFQQCYVKLEDFLTGKSQEIDIALDLSWVSSFQLKVLNQMKKIPFGKVATYKDIAAGIKSKGFQAIGTACGRNPFLLIYPCHRVIGSKGLGGFAHGLKMKKELLRLEQKIFLINP